MPVHSPASLVEALTRLPLLEPSQQAELPRLQAQFSDGGVLARELVRLGWLTSYQVERISQGRGEELVLGAYVLLESLGEGGMGMVFKARQCKLDRVVALKLIRKDRLGTPNAVRRFQREIMAAAQLAHPNVVRAYDADQVGDVHFFVMEFVPGTDLSRLVRERGRLPIAQACDYAHQAALGLQHAFERGLVHRDIKPANLLLTPAGVVKVLDMGVARLERPETGDDLAGTLTQDGGVLGTADYMAPEQARNSRAADIRADLYSLGCTLYFLLGGEVPFPGGGATEKLLHHALDAPRPLEELRPDAPPAVAAVVRNLMAKRPEDRYQTPAEAAAALAPLAGKPAPVLAPGHAPAAPGAAERPTATGSAGGETTETLEAAEILRQRAERQRRRSAERRRQYLSYAVGVLLSLVLCAAALWLFLRFSLPKPPSAAPTPRDEHPAEAAAAPLDPFEQWLKDVAAMPPDRQVKAVASKLKEHNLDFAGKLTPQFDPATGGVTALTLPTAEVTDLNPLRAFGTLRQLTLTGGGITKGSLSDLSPLKGLRLTSLSIASNPVVDLSPLKGMPLTYLVLSSTKVSDLSPLRDMPLATLYCVSTNVADLSPLRGAPLTTLYCDNTKVSDLSPLADMPLTHLSCSVTNVSDLLPLAGVPLVYLNIGSTAVSDLSPLQGLRLTYLYCMNTKITDLSPLRGMPLVSLYCPFQAERDAAVLRPIKTLTTINYKAAAKFWADVDAPRLPVKP